MLGVIGFLVVSFLLVAYAITFEKSARARQISSLDAYLAAFYIMAISCAVWATAVLYDIFVPQLVFMSDVLLLAATVCMLSILVPVMRSPALVILVSFVATGLITLRAWAYPPTAFVSENLLHFNLPRGPMIVIGAFFLAIWLPAGVKMINALGLPEKARRVRYALVSAYVTTMLMVAYFLSAVRPVMIVLTFASVAVLLLIMTIENIMLSKMTKHSDRGARHG